MKKYIVALAVSATFASAAPATAQGIPVIDPSSIAQTVKVVENGVQQVQQMKAQVEQLTNLKDTIGDIGVGEIGSILERAGLDFSTQQDTLLGQFRETVPGIIDGLANSELGRSLNVDGSAAQQARTSINAGRNFALSTFYRGSNSSADDITRRQAVREAALRDSATSGYATAVVTKVRLSESEKTITALNEQMAASTDLRTDVQNNTAVGMAQYQQMVIQTQLLAQLLEVQATGNMAAQTGSTN